MLLGAILVRAPHAALENRVVAFNGVRGDVTMRIFFPTVVDGIVAQEVRPRRDHAASAIRLPAA